MMSFFGLLFSPFFLLFIVLIVAAIFRTTNAAKGQKTENEFRKNARMLFLYATVSIALIMCVAYAISLFQNINNLIFEAEYINNSPNYNGPVQNGYIRNIIGSGAGLFVSGTLMLYFGLQIKKSK